MADPLRNSGLSEIEDHWQPVLVTEIFLVSAERREIPFPRKFVVARSPRPVQETSSRYETHLRAEDEVDAIARNPRCDFD
jgi:hypothetical protein